jgi:Cys-tRNA synthase (O-phospho-L-seryl-tRNA:Cys-tRNA synthase)
LRGIRVSAPSRRTHGFATNCERLLERFEQNNPAATPDACLRTELYCFTFNESSSQGNYADCRSCLRLQKVEQIPYLKAFAFEIGRIDRSCFEEGEIKLGIQLGKTVRAICAPIARLSQRSAGPHCTSVKCRGSRNRESPSHSCGSYCSSSSLSSSASAA